MIPTLHVAQSKARGEFEGALEFEYEPDGDLLDIPYASFAAPVKVHLAFSIAEDDSVEIKGLLSFILQGECSRCLEPATDEVSYEVEAVFVKGEGDGECYGYQGGIVRLQEMLRDAVLFALPSRLLCERCREEE